jgi:hypothetical protein
LAVRALGRCSVVHFPPAPDDISSSQ